MCKSFQNNITFGFQKNIYIHIYVQYACVWSTNSIERNGTDLGEAGRGESSRLESWQTNECTSKDLRIQRRKNTKLAPQEK